MTCHSVVVVVVDGVVVDGGLDCVFFGLDLLNRLNVVIWLLIGFRSV